jgi:hypothetical protein
VTSDLSVLPWLAQESSPQSNREAPPAFTARAGPDRNGWRQSLWKCDSPIS